MIGRPSSEVLDDRVADFLPAAAITQRGGLFLEIKREGTRLKKRNGRWANTPVEEQAAVLDLLGEACYIAQFAGGLEQATELIDSYLVPAWEPPLTITSDKPLRPEPVF